MTEWAANMLHYQQIAIEVAADVQQEQQDNRGRKMLPRSGKIFNIDDEVLVVRAEGTSSGKLSHVHTGPFTIVNIIGDKITVQSHIDGKSTDVHVTRLRPFSYDKTRTNPADLAYQELQVFVVEAVLQHDGDPRHKTEMKFLVKWQGFDESHNSWEPWTEKGTGTGLANNSVLHEYLISKKLSYLIPRGQRKREHLES